MENLHLVDGGNITHCNMFAELCAGAGYRCGLQLKKKKEAECIFLFLERGCARQRCGWAGTYACPRVHLLCCLQGVQSYSVTVNTHCEKEKEPPHVLS